MRISDWSSDVCSSDLAHGGGFVLHAFLTKDFLQMRHNGFCRHLLQIELQTARQHGNGNLLWVGRGQDELDVRRRLFERFQHGIESMAGQHVDFVDHVDLEAAARSEEHTSELQSLMRNSYAVFCL